MPKKKVLLAGESWVSTATHIKGFDQFPTVTYHTGADELLTALKDSDFDVTFMPAHEAQRDFPQTIRRFRPTMPSFCRISAPTRCCCIPIHGSIPSRPQTACACC